jgi:hypothetical protein
MTHLIDKLVDLGIVERQTNIADRRMTNILLTAEGEAFFEEHDSNIKNAIKETLSYLIDEELEGLSDSLRKLSDILPLLQGNKHRLSAKLPSLLDLKSHCPHICNSSAFHQILIS